MSMQSTRTRQGGRASASALLMALLMAGACVLLATAEIASAQGPARVDLNDDGLLDPADLACFWERWSGGACAGLVHDEDLDVNQDGIVSPEDGLAMQRVIAGTGPAADLWQPTVGSDGWTIFPQASDSRRIHVSSSLGNDAHHGLSPDFPVRTLARGYALLRQGSADWLLLRRGDVFQGPLGNQWGYWSLYGRSEEAPIVVTSYGDSSLPRPIIEAAQPAELGVVPSVIHMASNTDDPPVRDVWIVGLHLRAGFRLSGPDDSGAGMLGPDWLQALRYAARDIAYDAHGGRVLIEDVLSEGMSGGIAITPKLMPDGSQGAGDFVIRRYSLVKNYPATTHGGGIYASGVTGLIVEQSVFDHAGWDSRRPQTRTIFNHAAYWQGSVSRAVFRDNLVFSPSSHAIQMRGRDTYAVGNVIVEAPAGIQGGHRLANWPADAWTGAITGNVCVGGGTVPGGSSGYQIILERTGADARVFTNTVAWLRADPIVLPSGEVARPSPAAVWVGNQPMAQTWYVQGNRVWDRLGRFVRDDRPVRVPALMSVRNQFRTLEGENAADVTDADGVAPEVLAEATRRVRIAAAQRRGAWDPQGDPRSVREWLRAQVDAAHGGAR